MEPSRSPEPTPRGPPRGACRRASKKISVYGQRRGRNVQNLGVLGYPGQATRRGGLTSHALSPGRCRSRAGAPTVPALRGALCRGRQGRRSPRPPATTEAREGAPTMAVVTMRQMLDAGVHFGHQTRRWNPKMKRFIFTERNGIYIIDLQQTLSVHRPRLRVHQGDRRPRRHRAVRRHQAAGAGGDRRAGDPRVHALRQPALAGRHAHQLHDRAQASAAAQGPRGDGDLAASSTAAPRRRCCC